VRPGIIMDEKIKMAHGGGAAASRRLIEQVFLKYFDNKILRGMDDSAELPPCKGRLAFTTDSYVASPVEFPGGNIGKLAVCGTVNDLSVKGANPKWLSAAFILEEGLETALLERILAAMRDAANEAGVLIVTGDTKVVERGKADKIFITTAGVGEIPEGINISAANAKPGDAIIISGPLGAHGVALMNARHNLGIKSDIKTDSAPLNKLAAAAAQNGATVMRDITRGGLCAALNEIADAANVAIELDETLVPVEADVAAACALLGLDPLDIANEGRLIAFVPQQKSAQTLAAMRAVRYGEKAVIAGTVVSSGKAVVELKTKAGGRRILRLPEGEQLPRIC